eukprot:144790_1
MSAKMSIESETLATDSKEETKSTINDDNEQHKTTKSTDVTIQQQQQNEPENERKLQSKSVAIKLHNNGNNYNDTDTKETKEDIKEDIKEEIKNTIDDRYDGVVEQMSITQRVFDQQTGEQILQRDIPNKIIVARGKKISFYYERARRILRLFDGMIVTGFGTTVCIACSLVEVLKRNAMAEIIHIETKLAPPIHYVDIANINNPSQQRYYETATTPKTAIEFHLKVGKYGKYLSGYHQRKIIELFEKYDKLTGLVSIQDVKSMNLYQVFHSNNNQIVKAEKFINNVSNLTGPNNQFKLPDFIKYCSLIIHPLMKDNIFKKILYQNFQIGNYYNRNGQYNQ